MERTNKGENEWNVQIAGGKGGKKQTNSFRPESMRRWMKIVFLRLPDAFIHRQKGRRCGCARRTKMNRLSSSATISARMRRQRHLRPNKKKAPKINLSPVFYGVVWWSIERLHPSNKQPTSRGVSSRQNLIPPLWQRCVLDSGRMTTGPQSALGPLLEDVISWFQADWLILYEFFKFQSKWRRFKCRE